MSDQLVTPGTVLRIGRKRTQHQPRVLIEDNRVVIRTRCGLNPLPEGFTETTGFVTCDDCADGDQS